MFGSNVSRRSHFRISSSMLYLERKSGLHPEYMMQGCFRTWFKQTLVCLHRFGSFEVGRRESCQPDIVVLHDVRIKFTFAVEGCENLTPNFVASRLKDEMQLL
ncbi:hypothetical protein F2P81_002436 [Scophthalmus maximus]|uniref:Uncharacterized protein n=1 Tax=Scophthalmus maximus TaxID=52904 RepID=A0A6A4TGT0_SCOMX|nr:hypothetical protein F2P81_002436 [Scophthalmus maximus]